MSLKELISAGYDQNQKTETAFAVAARAAAHRAAGQEVFPFFPPLSLTWWALCVSFFFHFIAHLVRILKVKNGVKDRDEGPGRRQDSRSEG